MYNTKAKIDKYICHGIAPGLESRYTLLHKANVLRLGWAGRRCNQTHDPRQVKLETRHLAAHWQRDDN